MSKTFFYTLLSFSLMLASSCEKKSEKDQSEFQQIATEFESAWNKRDSHALADLWTEDGNLITPWSDEYNGKNEIERHFANELSDTMKSSQVSLSVQNVRFIDPETAFVDTNMTLTGMSFAGEKVVPFHDHAVFLMVKKDSKWLILIARPY